MSPFAIIPHLSINHIATKQISTLLPSSEWKLLQTQFMQSRYRNASQNFLKNKPLHHTSDDPHSPLLPPLWPTSYMLYIIRPSQGNSTKTYQSTVRPFKLYATQEPISTPCHHKSSNVLFSHLLPLRNECPPDPHYPTQHLKEPHECT